MPITTTTWNPLDKAAAITLSADLLSGSIASGVNDGIAKSTNAHNVGNWYFEIVCSNTTTNPEECAVGVGLGDCGTGAYASRKAKTFEWWGDGTLYYGAATKVLGTSFKYVTNDVLNFAVRLSDTGSTGSLWVGRNGTWWSNPVTGTAFLPGFSKSSTLLPIICPYRDSKSFTGRFGAAAFTYPTPDGFLPWEGTGEILTFTGQWNNGSDSGTVIFADRVLSIGDITESLMNGAESRGWVMQASVTLDDSDQFWTGSFAKGNQWLAGTFTLQQRFGTVWTPMLVGYVEPGGYSNGYGDRVIGLQLTSVLARNARDIVGYGENVRGTYDPYATNAWELGTVTAVGTDGTVTVLLSGTVNDVKMPYYSLVWQNVGGTIYPQSAEQSHLLAMSDRYGAGPSRDITFTSSVPDWCTTGQVLLVTEPWPTQSLLEIEVSRTAQYPSGGQTYNAVHPLQALWMDAARQAGLTWNTDSLATFGSRLMYYQMAVTSDVAASAGYYGGYPWSNGTSAYYYGGEKWSEVLNDLFTSVGATWTVNGAGQVRAYLYQPGAETVAGSLSFLSAINSEWSGGLTEGASDITVHSNYDPMDGYQGSLTLRTGANGPGVQYNARWQRSTGGALLASRLRFRLGSTTPNLSLQLDGSAWPNYQPGQTWEITDLPIEILPVAGSVFMIASKTYSFMNETATLDLIGEYSKVGIFYVGTVGTAPEPSELDGTDILW